ncbi:unnamed protein product [Hermetia illucens]|uniref:Anaphase-promoting complex subunit 2 n=2 Tax=Hermetia illucens TaxID=343691 RepID=A0A7R8YNJ7_HERIL|nr:unnamed protein product [Hermetia illucens]
MTDIDAVWERTCKVFPILKKTLSETSVGNEDIEHVIRELSALGLCESVYESAFIEFDFILRQQIVPRFWKHFESVPDPDTGFYNFQLAVHELYSDFSRAQEVLRRLTLFRQVCRLKNQEKVAKSEEATFDELFRSVLLSQLAANFNDIVYAFYKVSFRIFANSYDNNDQDEFAEDMIELNCNGCGKETERCRCQELVCAFNTTNKHLYKMHLLDKLAGYTLTNLIQERITAHVEETCKGVFDASHIKNLQKWLDTIVINWLTRIFNRGSSKISEGDGYTHNVIENFRIKLSYFLYETYAKLIIDQFFNIIIDFPDSQLAIDDLKVCLEKIDLRKHLIKTLKQSLEARLLHPGVNTMDILTGYVAAIKAIRHLDPSGVLLETTTEPIKEYLRKRSDTVRCVITGLTEEGPTDLAEELAKSETLKENVDVKGKDEMLNWEVWNPDPIDASPVPRPKRTSRSADIISMVVDIYGSKELFVNEYRNLLADRLLVQLDFNPEKEIRNLELLKLRFGDSLLHSCEVMLKDISDSKRINSHIQSDLNYSNGKAFPISSLILSSQFWPAFNKETLELPDEIQDEFKKYTTSYEAYKGNRTLVWRPVTGRVVLEIELAGRTLEMTVNPTQAAIIHYFQERNEWALEELSGLLKIPPSILRKRISFWQTQGLIKERDTDIYTLIDEMEQSQVDPSQSQEICEEDESESAMASASDQREEELQVFWSYIVGMLTNLDSMPIERIHQMLKMFASHGSGVEFTQEELKNFLQRKVREYKLIYNGGVYHLPK